MPYRKFGVVSLHHLRGNMGIEKEGAGQKKPGLNPSLGQIGRLTVWARASTREYGVEENKARLYCLWQERGFGPLREAPRQSLLVA